jgi:hypothetical protein
MVTDKLADEGMDERLRSSFNAFKVKDDRLADPYPMRAELGSLGSKLAKKLSILLIKALFGR